MGIRVKMLCLNNHKQLNGTHHVPGAIHISLGVFTHLNPHHKPNRWCGYPHVIEEVDEAQSG